MFGWGVGGCYLGFEVLESYNQLKIEINNDLKWLHSSFFLCFSPILCFRFWFQMCMWVVYLGWGLKFARIIYWFLHVEFWGFSEISNVFVYLSHSICYFVFIGFISVLRMLTLLKYCLKIFLLLLNWLNIFRKWNALSLIEILVMGR